MAGNEYFASDDVLELTASHPTTPASGDPVRWADRCGVALNAEDATSGKTVIAFRGVFRISVKGVDDAGNIAVAEGDDLYYVDADTPVVSKKTSGVYFGKALGAVTSGATATISVAVGGGAGQWRSGKLKSALIAGGAAGNLTVTGINPGDRIASVIVFATAAAIATATDLTSEFKVTAANTINNTGGTSTASNSVLVLYEDRTSA